MTWGSTQPEAWVGRSDNMIALGIALFIVGCLLIYEVVKRAQEERWLMV